MPIHTKKKPGGPFDRQKLLKHLEEQAEKSTIGDDYVPFVKKQPPKDNKPKVCSKQVGPSPGMGFKIK